MSKDQRIDGSDGASPHIVEYRSATRWPAGIGGLALLVLGLFSVSSTNSALGSIPWILVGAPFLVLVIRELRLRVAYFPTERTFEIRNLLRTHRLPREAIRRFALPEEPPKGFVYSFSGGRIVVAELIEGTQVPVHALWASLRVEADVLDFDAAVDVLNECLRPDDPS